MDEFGGTPGLVTLENVVEELLGDVVDTVEVEELDAESRPDGGFSVSGLTLIEDFNDALDLNLIDGNSDTIGATCFAD